MKKETFQKLNEIFYLTEKQEIKDMISQIMLSELEEEKVKIRKFNLFNMTANNPIGRPALSGVYHNNGMRIASDTYVLAVVKDGYPELLEGKILYKDGTFCNATYPDYKAVLNQYKVYSAPQLPYTSDDLRKAVTEAEYMAKMEVIRNNAKGKKKTHIRNTASVQFAEYHYPLNRIKHLVSFLDAYPTSVLCQYPKEQARYISLVARDKENNLFMVMPCVS